MQTDTTIAAVSTPPGRGGIAVIRISGEDAIRNAARFFLPKNGRPLEEAPSRFAVFGEIISKDTGETIDTGMATVFRAPASYTGENTVEISCHGGIALTEAVLSSAFLCGCVPAGPGEFTRRAFTNGKLSLTEAEAVIGLIDAESREAIKLTGSHVRGVLSSRLTSLCDEISSLIASLYAFIDYPDEDMTDIPIPELSGHLDKLISSLSSLASTYRTGHAVCEGIETAIIGRPNTGKSSLLNALLGRERAIVTDIPGTTRDTVEENAVIGGVRLKLIDTAGLRDPQDEVERIGTQRSGEKAREAELVLAVFDSSEEFTEDDRRTLDLMRDAAENGAEVIVLLNKSDKDGKFDRSIFEKETVFGISAKNGEGLDALRDHIAAMFRSGEIEYENQAVLSNARQYAAVANALSRVEAAKKALDDGFTADIAGLELESALASLGETDGRAVTEEVVHKIFSRFCVGK